MGGVFYVSQLLLREAELIFSRLRRLGEFQKEFYLCIKRDTRKILAVNSQKTSGASHCEKNPILFCQ